MVFIGTYPHEFHIIPIPAS